jgi:cytochrome c556
MKALFVVLTVVFVLLATTTALSQPEKTTRDFMRAKLKHSQEILEGLAVENYPQIAKNAQELALLSHATNWDVFQTELYVAHSREFRRAALELRDQAKKSNLEGAALAYLEVTMKCVNCHKYVRQIRTAKVDR